MSRIEKQFAALKSAGKKGLVTFIMAGDPDEKAFMEVLEALPGNGADFIEVGMPFSDPMADGPAIQAAGLRALNAGMTLKRTLELLQQFRSKNDGTPLILMGYINPILHYGADKFMQDAAASGVDGVIIVDMPPEESAELAPQAKAAGLDLIRLVTPTTDENRLPKVLDGASGFLYYVSITGVTGTASADVDKVSEHIKMVRKHTDLPIAIGFGIKTPEDAASLSKTADAIVVGSAIVQTIEKNQGDSALATTIGGQVFSLKQAI